MHQNDRSTPLENSLLANVVVSTVWLHAVLPWVFLHAVRGGGGFALGGPSPRIYSPSSDRPTRLSSSFGAREAAMGMKCSYCIFLNFSIWGRASPLDSERLATHRMFSLIPETYFCSDGYLNTWPFGWQSITLTNRLPRPGTLRNLRSMCSQINSRAEVRSQSLRAFYYSWMNVLVVWCL